MELASDSRNWIRRHREQMALAQTTHSQNPEHSTPPRTRCSWERAGPLRWVSSGRLVIVVPARVRSSATRPRPPFGAARRDGRGGGDRASSAGRGGPCNGASSLDRDMGLERAGAGSHISFRCDGSAPTRSGGVGDMSGTQPIRRISAESWLDDTSAQPREPLRSVRLQISTRCPVARSWQDDRLRRPCSAHVNRASAHTAKDYPL